MSLSLKDATIYAGLLFSTWGFFGAAFMGLDQQDYFSLIIGTILGVVVLEAYVQLRNRRVKA